MSGRLVYKRVAVAYHTDQQGIVKRYEKIMKVVQKVLKNGGSVDLRTYYEDFHNLYMDIELRWD